MKLQQLTENEIMRRAKQGRENMRIDLLFAALPAAVTPPDDHKYVVDYRMARVVDLGPNKAHVTLALMAANRSAALAMLYAFNPRPLVLAANETDFIQPLYPRPNRERDAKPIAPVYYHWAKTAGRPSLKQLVWFWEYAEYQHTMVTCDIEDDPAEMDVAYKTLFNFPAGGHPIYRSGASIGSWEHELFVYFDHQSIEDFGDKFLEQGGPVGMADYF